MLEKTHTSSDRTQQELAGLAQVDFFKGASIARMPQRQTTADAPRHDFQFLPGAGECFRRVVLVRFGFGRFEIPNAQQNRFQHRLRHGGTPLLRSARTSPLRATVTISSRPAVGRMLRVGIRQHPRLYRRSGDRASIWNANRASRDAVLQHVVHRATKHDRPGGTRVSISLAWG